MSRRSLGMVMAVMMMMMVVWLAPAPVAGQNPTAATDAAALRTPWGDPDLQGVWSYATITPLQRPAALTGREVPDG